MKTRIAELLILGACLALTGGCVSWWSHQETVQDLEAASSKVQALQRKTEDLQHALDTVNQAREGAEAVRGGLEEQVRNLQEDLDRAKRARETAEAAGLELDNRIKILQQQLQASERERDQYKAALAASVERAGRERQRPGTGKVTAPKKPTQTPVPQTGREKKAE